MIHAIYSLLHSLLSLFLGSGTVYVVAIMIERLVEEFLL